MFHGPSHHPLGRASPSRLTAVTCTLLLGCSPGIGATAADTGAPASDTGKPAADTGCVAPNGLMPQGVWLSWDAATIWVDVEASGEATIYLCDTVTTVEEASVDSGHVDWDVEWTAVGNGEFGYSGPGNIKGEVCGDVAALVMGPMASSPVDFTLHPEETAGAGCD